MYYKQTTNLVKCPFCGTVKEIEYEAQSAITENYELEDIAYVLEQGLSFSIHEECPHCEKGFRIHYINTTKVQQDLMFDVVALPEGQYPTAKECDKHKRQIGYTVVNNEATLSSGHLMVYSSIRKALNMSAEEGFFKISPDYAVFEIAYVPSDIVDQHKNYITVKITPSLVSTFVFFGNEPEEEQD